MKHLADDFPVHEVVGMEHLNAHEMELGRDEVEIVTDSDDVGV